MPDDFSDLDQLAATVDGTLLRDPSGFVWSYPGAPQPSGNVSNLRLPSSTATDARVQAAISANAYVPAETDGAGRVVAVRRFDPSASPRRRVLTAAMIGTADARSDVNALTGTFFPPL